VVPPARPAVGTPRCALAASANEAKSTSPADVLANVTARTPSFILIPNPAFRTRCAVIATGLHFACKVSRYSLSLLTCKMTMR